MERKSTDEAGADPVLVCLAGLVLLCLVGSLSVYWAAGQVLTAAADHNAYVMIIGPGDKMVSDNAELEAQVNDARSALAGARQLALALALATAAIGTALMVRVATRVGVAPGSSPRKAGKGLKRAA